MTRLRLPRLTLAQALCEACGVHVGALIGGIGVGRWCTCCLSNRDRALEEPCPVAEAQVAA